MTEGIFKQNIFNLCKFYSTAVNSSFFAGETEVNMEFLLISIKRSLSHGIEEASIICIADN